MKEWLTAQEIADARLPQLPLTKRGINDFADREGWNADAFYCRKRSGRGGGMEYHVRLLPTVARVAYHTRHVVVGLPAMPAAANDTVVTIRPAISKRAALERDARLAIVAAFKRFQKGSSLRLEQAAQIFCDDWRLGRVSIDDWVHDVVPKLSKGSLKRWLSKARTGAELGVDRGAARKGTGTLDTANGGEVRVFVLGLIAHQPHLSAEQIRDQVRARFGDTLEASSKGFQKTVCVPPVRAFQRLVATLKATEKVVLTKLTDPDTYRSTMRVAGVGTLRHVTEPNALWQIDASPVDALCNDGRHSIYVCVDIATRRMILLMSRTPRAAAVGLLIRKAILAWGVPQEIKTDNGSDFTAKATVRLLGSLGIEMTLSDAFSPEQKGFVERAIGSFQRDCVGLVPGFVGHSVADRKQIEGRKAFAQRLGEDDAKTFMVQCAAGEMQALFDGWATIRYQHRTHGGLKGRTPFQVAASADYAIRRVDERALDILLAPIAGGDGTRVMQKTGIRVDGFHYLTGKVLPGTRVLVRHDPLDKGRVMLFDVADELYLGEAICAELAGIDPAAFVQAEREQQADILREKTKAIEAVRRELRNGPALIHRAREVWLRDQPNVVALPKPERPHVTPQISAAMDVFEPVSRPRSVDPIVAAEQKRLIEELGDITAPATPRQQTTTRPIETGAKVTALPESPKARYARFDAIQRAIDAGAPVDPADAIACGRYQSTSEYRGQKALHEDYGDEYLAR